MRRLFPVMLLLAACGLTACDWLDRNGERQSEGERQVSAVRDGLPPGTVRTVLDLVLLGMGIYATAKGQKNGKTLAATEARDYNADEAHSMAKALRETGYLPKA